MIQRRCDNNSDVTVRLRDVMRHGSSAMRRLVTRSHSIRPYGTSMLRNSCLTQRRTTAYNTGFR